MTVIIVGIILLVAILFFFNKLKNIIEFTKDSLQWDISDIKNSSKSRINLDFGINYEMVVVNTDNQNIVCTFQHAFAPIISEVGQIMSFDTPDAGYVEATIVSTNHYHKVNSPTFIFVYVKDAHPIEIPFDFKRIEEFKTNHTMN